MTFIRRKKFNEKEYAYLVETIKTDSGPRQKVKQYLGKVHKLEKNEISNTTETITSTISSSNNIDFLNKMIIRELKQNGLKEKNNEFQNKSIVFSSEKLSLNKKTNNKPAVANINEGYLCDFTLKRISMFNKTEDLTKDAQTLAKYFLEAGLQISKEEFVNYYQLL